ncbi:MAG TPA: ADP-ribosylglycohydrolase family protein [Spirochaetia bacterium]|nr:ADP-ribosylglycohydrolase family protein [Spirochaetia bacterium]
MIGAIAGDIIGSIYEWDRIKHKSFALFDDRMSFTDDSVLTVATAAALLENRGKGLPTIADFSRFYRDFGRRYPDRGWGARFSAWLAGDDDTPYGSFGNGSAMRVSPVGWEFDREEDTLSCAKASAIVSHNHPEGIKGAEAIALAVYLARRARAGTWPVSATGTPARPAEHAVRFALAREIENRFGYDLGRLVSDIRPSYAFDETCQGTVPEAIVCFLDSVSFEDAIRNAVSLGGDSDTLACIAGAIAEAYYGVPEPIASFARSRLPAELLSVIDAFESSHV